MHNLFCSFKVRVVFDASVQYGDFVAIDNVVVLQEDSTGMCHNADFILTLGFSSLFI